MSIHLYYMNFFVLVKSKTSNQEGRRLIKTLAGGGVVCSTIPSHEILSDLRLWLRNRNVDCRYVIASHP